MDIHSDTELGTGIDDCLLCIDGMRPAGVDPVLGPVYQWCPACIELCGACYGVGVFPGLYEYFGYLADALWTLGFTITHCRGCLGVTLITPGGTP